MGVDALRVYFITMKLGINKTIPEIIMVAM